MVYTLLCFFLLCVSSWIGVICVDIHNFTIFRRTPFSFLKFNYCVLFSRIIASVLISITNSHEIYTWGLPNFILRITVHHQYLWYLGNGYLFPQIEPSAFIIKHCCFCYLLQKITIILHFLYNCSNKNV